MIVEIDITSANPFARRIEYIIDNNSLGYLEYSLIYDRKDKDHLEIIKYRYMNVIFDEVELYYHPEMQRQFTNIMLKT